MIACDEAIAQRDALLAACERMKAALQAAERRLEYLEVDANESPVVEAVRDAVFAGILAMQRAGR